MQTIKLAAVKRDVYGKKNSKALRREGLVPCVLYGGEAEETFSISEKDLKPLIYTANAYLVEIDIEGKQEIAVMREVQFHPVKEQIMHIDFYRVQTGKPIVIEVPVRLTGSPVGVKLGGRLLQNRRKVTISALAENLPDHITIDVSDLNIGKAIFVGDLKIDKVTFLTPATAALCAVRTTRATVDDTTTAATDADAATDATAAPDADADASKDKE